MLSGSAVQDHNDALLPQIFHDTEAGDCHFSQTPHANNVSNSASPSLQGFGLAGASDFTCLQSANMCQTPC